VTGGQDVAGAGTTDYAGLARAAGIGRVYAFAEAEAWRTAAPDVLGGPGPAFAWLTVQGVRGHKTPSPPRPMGEQVERLRAAVS
jgi:sulfopyruvate decarboxylase subunit beta